MPVTRAEAALIDAVLEFATMSLEPGAVERHFGRVPIPAPMGGWERGIPPAQFRHDQRRLRRWLDAIASRDPRRLRAVARGLNRILGRTYQTQARLNAALEPEFRYAPSGVEAACALGIWLLFYHALLKRLRSCPLPGCGRFHVTYTGRVWNYCSVDHQREGERRKAVERVKRWRIYGKGGGRHARTHRATHEEEP